MSPSSLASEEEVRFIFDFSRVTELGYTVVLLGLYNGIYQFQSEGYGLWLLNLNRVKVFLLFESFIIDKYFSSS